MAPVEELDEERKAEEGYAQYDREDIVVDHRVVGLFPDHVGEADENRETCFQVSFEEQADDCAPEQCLIVLVVPLIGTLARVLAAPGEEPDAALDDVDVDQHVARAQVLNRVHTGVPSGLERQVERFFGRKVEECRDNHWRQHVKSGHRDDERDEEVGIRGERCVEKWHVHGQLQTIEHGPELI